MSRIKDRCSQSEVSMLSIIRELFAAQMHWVNVFIRKFTVHILLKPGLENFEHYFTSM